MSNDFELWIDWSQVSAKYEWLAVDYNGVAYLFRVKPKAYGYAWNTLDSDLSRADSIPSLICTGVNESNWEQAIIERPKKSQPIPKDILRLPSDILSIMLRDPLDDVSRLVWILNDTEDKMAVSALQSAIVDTLRNNGFINSDTKD